MLREIFESRMNRTWYGGRHPGLLLRSLERIYARVSARRQSLARGKIPDDLACRPIVVVGNITAGGTGKTPLVIRLVHILQAAGLTPAVVSRGYGRQGSELMLLGASVPVSRSGDEPQLIMDRTGVEVAVGEDRNEATRLLFLRGADLVISDDGLQRTDFPRSYEICVVDGARGLGNGHLLPAGPLREHPGRLASVDVVVVNEATGDFSLTGHSPRSMIEMRLEPGRLHELSGPSVLTIEEWREMAGHRPVHAVAGIGNPDRFFELLTQLGIDYAPRAFPDHHTYTAADFSDTGDEMIIMTEKDAVKCRELGLSNAWYLPVSAQLPEDWEQGFANRMKAEVEVAGKVR